MKLIIINGPCGIGKSTIATSLHDRLPLSFLLDIDAQTRFISQYKQHDLERREMAKLISLGIIEGCLKAHQNIIIDKMTFDTSILDTYYEIGRRFSAEVYELILWAPKDVVMSRAHARGWKEGSLLTPEKCERFWEEIDKLKEQRPLATVIDVSEQTEQETAQYVESLLRLNP